MSPRILGESSPMGLHPPRTVSPIRSLFGLSVAFCSVSSGSSSVPAANSTRSSREGESNVELSPVMLDDLGLGQAADVRNTSRISGIDTLPTSCGWSRAVRVGEFPTNVSIGGGRVETRTALLNTRASMDGSASPRKCARRRNPRPGSSVLAHARVHYCLVTQLCCTTPVRSCISQ